MKSRYPETSCYRCGGNQQDLSIKSHPRGAERSGLNKLSPLIIGTRFPLQYHREPFKVRPELFLYPAKHGNRATVKEAVVRKGRERGARGSVRASGQWAWKTREKWAGGGKKNNIFVILSILSNLLKEFTEFFLVTLLSKQTTFSTHCTKQNRFWTLFVTLLSGSLL